MRVSTIEIDEGFQRHRRVAVDTMRQAGLLSAGTMAMAARGKHADLRER